ncbi:hypothetical protein Hamer_G029564, partial [Homarus americanus]
PLLHQWTKANALFKPPVINQCRTIELKLTKLWHKTVETSLGKGNLARKNEFLHTLDTLFDILTCKCSIQLCSESNCSHSGKRENNSHIDCGCPREKKIPAQRTKAEGQGSMQMGSIDYSETKKQIANAKKREQIERGNKENESEKPSKEEKLPRCLSFFDSSSDERKQHKELINDMIVPLLHQWTKANALFKPPVINQCRTIELKLTKLWHKAVETSLGKGNLARKNEFLHTLDTLFDILTCKCSIPLCSESNCSHSGKRENNSHIDCGCPREKKIPVLELEFIKAQRTKAESQGSMQMGSIDYSETKKQIANAKKREQIREREQKKKMKSEEAIQREEELCQDVYHFFDSSSDEQEATSDDSKRENNSHIDCGCPREKKIPVLELEFIKAQRTKAEGQGSMQMGSIDYSETKKQIANAKKREQIREREQKKKMKSEEAIQREEELCQDKSSPINVNATKLSELVDLSLEVLEPPLTTSLTSQELRNLKETPMQVPKWPSHTQSVERCVKMVTEAADHVYSHERRE